MRICGRYTVYLRRMDEELSEITSHVELEKFIEKWTRPVRVTRRKLQAAPALGLWINAERLLTVGRLAEDAKNKANEWKAVEKILAGEIA